MITYVIVVAVSFVAVRYFVASCSEDKRQQMVRQFKYAQECLLLISGYIKEIFGRKYIFTMKFIKKNYIVDTGIVLNFDLRWQTYSHVLLNLHSYTA